MQKSSLSLLFSAVALIISFLYFLSFHAFRKSNIFRYNNENIFLKLNDKFDIIFLDPPYKDKNLENLLIKIKDQNILNKNGIIVLHRHKNETDSLPPSFQIIEQKVYGISKIIFLTYLN